MLEAVNCTGYRPILRRTLTAAGRLNGALGPWTGTKESASNAQRHRCKWLFQVFVEVSQRTVVQYALNFNQHCFELFLTDSCITEGFLEATFYVKNPSPPRGARIIELPGNSMEVEKSFQT